MDPQIIFQGIECPNLRLQAKTLLEDLVQLCPSDSAVMATFQHIQDDFLAEIKVASESVYMQAVDKASGLTDCLDHVRANMLGQIADWRSHRFAC